MADRDALGQLLLRRIADLALGYAWGKVCFTSWDATLDHLGERLCRYSRWPEALRLLLHTLYPCYFVYNSMKRLSGPEGPVKPAHSARWRALLAVACVGVSVLAMRAGARERSRQRQPDP
jgi:hypothetical protein